MLYKFDRDEIEKSIQKFRNGLLTQSSQMVVRSTIIHGDCFIFTPQEYAVLRSEIADHFNVHPNDVLVVGSAKLGFSIAPHKRYNHFHDGSDIDIAIVSSLLFDNIWEQAFSYASGGAYWPKKEQFVRFLFQGWIRPDKLPSELANAWFEYFRVLTCTGNHGPYKISGGLYKSFRFLETYQCDCVNICKNEEA